MSDGNFNRALLPSTPYASGLKTGKAMGRMKAIEAFSEWLNKELPQLTDAEAARMKESFRKLL